MHTQLKDTGNTTKWVVYGLLRNVCLEEDLSKIERKGTSTQYFVAISPTSSFYDERRVQKIAGTWKNTIKNIPTLPQYGQSTFPSLEPEVSLYLPDLDKEVLEYGLRNNILPDLENYYRQMYKTFERIEEIKITLISDYEMENYHKIRFNLKTKNSVENLLREEAEFKKSIRNLIPRDARTHFVLTTQIT